MASTSQGTGLAQLANSSSARQGHHHTPSLSPMASSVGSWRCIDHGASAVYPKQGKKREGWRHVAGTGVNSRRCQQAARTGEVGWSAHSATPEGRGIQWPAAGARKGDHGTAAAPPKKQGRGLEVHRQCGWEQAAASTNQPAGAE